MAAKTKKVTLTKAPKIERMSMHKALEALLKRESGREDIEFKDAPSTHMQLMAERPITERAGYPIKRAKGSVDPVSWACGDGRKIIVDFKRHAWLPDEWGQGVKITKSTSHSTGVQGGTYTVIIAPDGKVFYHRAVAEEYAGKQFTIEAGFNGQVRLAQLRAQETVQLVRMQIKDISSSRSLIGTDSDGSFFSLLSTPERACLQGKDKFHFAVVSARRATSRQGVQDIFAVQSQLLDAGVTPTWYVDAESLEDYRKLGLKAEAGGKLTPSRNKALIDAYRIRKVCVQISDDIKAWEYRHGKQAKSKDDDAANAAHAAAKRFIISPVAAARFIFAKMCGCPEKQKPHLGGVYMLGSCARTFGAEAFSRNHFIIGDFFVADVSSELKVKFDESMTLKEDYDFACSHIKTYGSVMRCDRMTLNVKHYSNSGGACSNRDGKGAAERKNIAILMEKWPRAFRLNPKRKNEVIMRWRNDAKSALPSVSDESDCDEEGTHQASKTPRRALQQNISTLPSGDKTPATSGKTRGKVVVTRKAHRVKSAKLGSNIRKFKKVVLKASAIKQGRPKQTRQ